MTPSLRGHGQVKRWAGLWLLWLSLAGALSPTHAGAAVLAQDDARAVRSVIQAQLDAFAADDAERAFSYASATIRTQFGDAATFMAMVRAGYPMVVRPATVSFFLAREADGAVWQVVQLRDRAGRLWKATYQLERQADAGWRINGCAVVADDGKSST
jgi:hypothetical protein